MLLLQALRNRAACCRLSDVAASHARQRSRLQAVLLARRGSQASESRL
jgi:hypothetical protein